MKFQTEHSHFKTRHKKKIVKMIGKKAHTRNEITNAKANERERETECEKENESDGEQQIVVLKMWEKCKKFHFGFLLHMQNILTQTHIYIGHTGNVGDRKRATHRFSQFVFHFWTASHKRGNCKVVRSHSLYSTFTIFVLSFFGVFNASLAAWQSHFVQVKLPAVIMSVGIIQISFWVNVMRATFDNGPICSSFFLVLCSLSLPRSWKTTNKSYENVRSKRKRVKSNGKIKLTKKKWTAAGRTHHERIHSK